MDRVKKKNVAEAANIQNMNNLEIENKSINNNNMNGYTVYHINQIIVKQTYVTLNIKKKKRVADVQQINEYNKIHSIRKSSIIHNILANDIFYAFQISILSIYVQPLNKTIDIFLYDTDTVLDIKIRIFQALEAMYKQKIDEIYLSEFSFLLNTRELLADVDNVNIKKLLKHEEPLIKDLIKGNVLNIVLRIKDLKTEEYFLRNYLNHMKTKDDHFIQIVKLIKKNKEMANCILKIQEKVTDWIITITSLKGRIKAYFTISSSFSHSQKGVLEYQKENLYEIEFLITDPTEDDKYQVFYSRLEEYQNLINAIQKLDTSIKKPNTNFDTMNYSSAKELLNSKIDEQEFNVRVYGMFGLKSDRVLKLTQRYEMELFERKANKTLRFLAQYFLRDLATMTPKKEGSQKIIFTFQNSKKIKSLKILFLSKDELMIFQEFFKQLTNLVEESKSALLTDKTNKIHNKRYSWFTGPVKNIIVRSYDGEIVELIFNIINISDKESKQKLRLDLRHYLVEFLNSNEHLVKTLMIIDIRYLEKSNRDSRKVNLLLETKKISILFSDMRSKALFESAIYHKILSMYTLTVRRPEPLEKASIFITTFNVGSCEPPKELDIWLKRSLECQVIAIGLQEAKNSSWLESLHKYYQSYDFLLINVVTMWKMMLCVFVTKKYANYVSNVEADCKATGVANIIGNKGGVGISLSIMETSFCFISSHLAAKPGNLLLRLQNFYDLMKNLRFGDKRFEVTSNFDYFFFFGDTNFRVDYPYDKAVNEIDNGFYDNLRKHDQLYKEKKNHQFTNILEEGIIKFKPSYRRLRHEMGFSNKNNQTPSWCDRILVKGQPARDIKIKEYNSVEMFFGSDHRPVYGIYEISLETPFIPIPPLHLKNQLLSGIIKFNKLVIEYNFEDFAEFSDFESSLPSNIELSLNFHSKFLNGTYCTMPLKITSKAGPWLLQENLIPLLNIPVADDKYLKHKYINIYLATINENRQELLLGQGSMPLSPLINSKFSTANFTAPLHLYGREIGSIYGEMTYNLIESEIALEEF